MQRSASLRIEAELSTTALRLLAQSNCDEKVDGSIGHVGGVMWCGVGLGQIVSGSSNHVMTGTKIQVNRLHCG